MSGFPPPHYGPASVYLISLPGSGLLYVGWTGKSLRVRWQCHVGYARMGNDRPLYRAIRAHGAEAFVVSEIARFNSHETARRYERSMIDALDTCHPFGFNLWPRWKSWPPKIIATRPLAPQSPAGETTHGE